MSGVSGVSGRRVGTRRAAAHRGYRRDVSVPGSWKPVRRGQGPTPAELRASDGDRERVAELLRAAMGDGRLGIDEHAERIERAYAARTLGELAGITTDLVPWQDQPIQVHVNPPQVMFRTERRGGRWVVPERYPITAFCGTIELDLREALLQRRHVVVQANVMLGRVKLVVPEGVRVLYTGRSWFGTRELRVRPGDAVDGPVIEVAGTLILGKLSARTPKRRWRDRFRRRATQEAAKRIGRA